MEFHVPKKSSLDEVYQGYFEKISIRDLYKIEAQKWFFPWRREFFTNSREVYKLMVKGSAEIQALISLEHDEGFILVEFVESARHNQINEGLFVGGAVLSFACILSEKNGNDGVVCISIKMNKKLISYYESLGAIHIGNNRMVIDKIASRELIELYLYKGE